MTEAASKMIGAKFGFRASLLSCDSKLGPKLWSQGQTRGGAGTVREPEPKSEPSHEPSAAAFSPKPKPELGPKSRGSIIINFLL